MAIEILISSFRFASVLFNGFGKLSRCRLSCFGPFDLIHPPKEKPFKLFCLSIFRLRTNQMRFNSNSIIVSCALHNIFTFLFHTTLLQSRSIAVNCNGQETRIPRYKQDILIGFITTIYRTRWHRCLIFRVRVLVFNFIFKNMSVILWRSALLVEVT